MPRTDPAELCFPPGKLLAQGLSAHLGKALDKQFWAKEECSPKKPRGFYEKRLLKCKQKKKKQNKAKKNPTKTSNSSAGRELLLFVIYRFWVGREGGILGPDRPGAASIPSIPVRSLTSVTKPRLQLGVPTNPIPPRPSWLRPAPAKPNPWKNCSYKGFRGRENTNSLQDAPLTPQQSGRNYSSSGKN